MKKRVISVVSLLLMLLGVLTMTAAAVEVPDLERTGSISFDMTFQNTPVPGGSLTLYHVAQVHLENEADFSLAYVEAYAECGVSLEDLSAAETARALADFTAANGIQGLKGQIDENGHIAFENLELGLYLLVQEDAAPGYEAASPFLVTVPGREDETYIYDVNATPKLQLEQAPTEPTEPPTEPPTRPTEPELPQTGQNNWPVPVMAGFGIFLLLTGLVLRLSARGKRHES